MTKNAQPEVEATILIKRFKDRTMAFEITLNGDWTPRHLIAIHPHLVKANRQRLAKLMREATVTKQKEEETKNG